MIYITEIPEKLLFSWMHIRIWVTIHFSYKMCRLFNNISFTRITFDTSNFLKWFICFPFLSSLQAIVVCFRLHFSKDNTTSNTASAIVQQVISIVFERVMAEDEAHAGEYTPLPSHLLLSSFLPLLLISFQHWVLQHLQTLPLPKQATALTHCSFCLAWT